MKITRVGSVPSRRGPSEWFTGVVWQDPIIDAPPPARANVARVSFEPGARTAWHTHPYGQTLHVLTGTGRVQCAGRPAQAIRAGDTVWIPPDEKHWHGAAPDCGMVHLAIHERREDSVVTWLEPVSDAEYAAAPEQAAS